MTSSTPTRVWTSGKPPQTGDRLTGYVVVFAGANPPTLGAVASMLLQGSETDQYEAEFSLRQMPATEAQETSQGLVRASRALERRRKP